MKTEFEFHDPSFTSSMTDEKNGLKITYPLVSKPDIKEVSGQIRLNAEKYFASRSSEDIQKTFDKIDSSFRDPDSPENIELVEVIHRSCGFSKHDIRLWGLGLFGPLITYEPAMRGYFINRAVRTGSTTETRYGYLKRFGLLNIFSRWKEPGLISHFISGNVVGYTAVLSRIGMPLKEKGAAQIMKLPSTASLFPMIYLEKMEGIDPDLRKTIACGYWKGGDDSIEKSIIEESDAINILSSDQSIKDLQLRINKYHRGIPSLMHGHKIGIAYISKEFTDDEYMLEKTIEGLVLDISAFDGGACYTVKNIYVQGNVRKFGAMLFSKLEEFERNISAVSEYSKPTGRSLDLVYRGSSDVISSAGKSVFVRVKEEAEFWKPDELFRYVQVMKVADEKEVYNIIRRESHFLQTAIIAVPDEKILPLLLLFGSAGVSNIHYPGSASLMNVFEEPHDGEFDPVRIRYNYSARFAATNFKANKDWIQ